MRLYGGDRVTIAGTRVSRRGKGGQSASRCKGRSGCRGPPVPSDGDGCESTGENDVEVPPRAPPRPESAQSRPWPDPGGTATAEELVAGALEMYKAERAGAAASAEGTHWFIRFGPEVPDALAQRFYLGDCVASDVARALRAAPPARADPALVRGPEALANLFSQGHGRGKPARGP